MRAFLNFAEKQEIVGVEEELPRDRKGEIAVWLFHELCVPELRRFPKVGKLILGAPVPFDFAGKMKEGARLTDQIEGDICERDVFFEHRSVSAPLGQPVAEDQAVIAEAQKKINERFLRAGVHAHQKPLTVFGIL